MQRKVIQLAGKTFVVSLPSKWVKEQGIKKGEEVEVKTNGGELTISKTNCSGEKSAFFSSGDAGIFLKRCLVSLYNEGFSEVTIELSDPEKIKPVQEVLNQLVGFEVIEHKKNNITIKDVSGQAHNEFPKLLRRLFLLTECLVCDTSEAVANNDRKALKSIVDRDIEINKLANYCLRSIAVTQEQKFWERHIFLAERIGDECKNLAAYLSSKTTMDKNTEILLKEVGLFLNKVFQLLFQQEKEKARDIGSKYESLKKAINNSLLKKDADTQALAHLQTLLRYSIGLVEPSVTKIFAKTL